MSLAVIFIVIAAGIIIRDRKDWPGYAIIILGAIYIGTMPVGPRLTGWLNGFGKWLDATLMGFIS